MVELDIIQLKSKNITFVSKKVIFIHQQYSIKTSVEYCKNLKKVYFNRMEFNRNLKILFFSKPVSNTVLNKIKPVKNYKSTKKT